MSPTPLVSIVTPAFNEEQFLPTMLASLQAQTYDSWELLLVDDGSTDGTAAVIEDWAARDARIKAVSVGTKMGKVAAFNAAFAASSGDLICHVGGDDFLPTDSLTIRVQEMSGIEGPGVMLGKLQMVDSASKVISPPFPRGPNGSQSSPGATYTRILADLLFPIPEILLSEDIWLGNGAVACADSVVHSLETLIYYRVHAQNSNPRHKSFRDMTESIHRRAEALPLLLSSDLPIGPEARAAMQVRVLAEKFRHEGRLLSLISLQEVTLVDKLALLSMSNPALWRLRQRFGVRATGWRGR